MAKADATARSSAAAKPRLDKDALLLLYREIVEKAEQALLDERATMRSVPRGG
jgi:hypothetical protein